MARSSLSRDLLVERIVDLLDKQGVDAEDIGSIRRINMWQGFHKDAEGNAQVVDLAGIEISPKWHMDPEWPVVQPAARVKVQVQGRRPQRSTGHRTTLVVSDLQVGYRRYEDGTLDPFHDEVAIKLVRELAVDMQPDCIVFIGDGCDFPEWSSKFLVSPEFTLTTQPTIDRMHEELAIYRALFPQAKIVLLEGNHDARLGAAITRNAMGALRLRRANTPASWPVLSLPHLLHLQELDVEYVGGYPAGKYQIAAGGGFQTPLVAIHGSSTDMVAVARRERQSVIQGHTHRVTSATMTYEVSGRPEQVQAWAVGTLARIDGAVPSTRGGSSPDGRPVKQWEPWQQAVAVVTESEYGWAVEPVLIHDGRALFRGKGYGHGPG